MESRAEDMQPTRRHPLDIHPAAPRGSYAGVERAIRIVKIAINLPKPLAA
jgi:hypothetical protein